MLGDHSFQKSITETGFEETGEMPRKCRTSGKNLCVLRLHGEVHRLVLWSSEVRFV